MKKIKKEKDNERNNSYALTLSVEAFVRREEERPSSFKDTKEIKLAKCFLEKVQISPFSEATSIAGLKKLFCREIEILKMQLIGEQLSFFPTPATNPAIASINRNIERNISMYQKFIDACDYKALVAPRFSVVDKYIPKENGGKTIEVWLVDRLGLIKNEYFGCGSSIYSLEYRAAHGFAMDKIKVYYPNGVNAKDHFPQFAKK